MADAPGRPAGQVHRSATRGGWAGSASAGTASASIGHDGNTIGQAAFLRVLPDAGPRGHAADQRRQHPRPLRGPLPRDLRRARRRRDAAAARAAGASRSTVDVDAVRRHATSGPSCGMEVFVGDDGPMLRTTVVGPLAEMVPDPVEEHPLVPVGPALFAGQAAGGRDLVPGHVLRAADRRALPALRRAGHPAGGLMDLDRCCSPTSATLVECESPSSDLAAVARSRRRRRPGRHRAARRRARADRARRPHPPALAARRRPVAGAAARPPRHGLAARLAGRPTRAPSRTACCAGPGCFDMKAGLVMAFHAARRACDGVTLLVTGDEELGSPSSRGLIEDEARLAEAALVLEASADGGALKTERKGVSLYDVRVRRPRRARRARARARASTRPSSSPTRCCAVSALGDPAPAPPSRRPSPRAGTTTNTVPAEGSFAVDVRVRTARRAGPGRRARCARCAPVLPGAALEVHRRAQPPAAGGRVVGGAVRAGPRRSPYGSGLPEPTARRGRRRLRRQLHRRRRHAHARRARRGRRRRARRRRARPGRRAARPHRAAARAGRGAAGATPPTNRPATTGAARP